MSNPAVADQLEASRDEVDYLFTQNLTCVLNGRPKEGYLDQLQPVGGEWWPYEEEFHSVSDRLGVSLPVYCMEVRKLINQVTGPHRMHVS